MMDPVHPPTAGRTPDSIGLYEPTVTAPVPPRGPRWLWPTLAALAGMIGLAVGGIIGSSTGDDGPHVPQGCLDAIAAAEEGFSYSADAVEGSQRAFDALLVFDGAELAAATDDVSVATDRLNALHPRWEVARTECRTAAQ